MNSTDALPPACVKLLHEKVRRRLTFAQISAELSRDEMWTAALFYGRASPTHKDIRQLASLLSLSAETLEEDFHMAGPPMRDICNTPTNPVVAPFCDAIKLYEPAIRSILVEKMGDGAVSGPHMKVRVEKIENRQSEVRLVLESKYVPYQSW
ncbi:Cyanate hydratase [Coemansia sp. RSA 988]|nr:Cyanate hydratase [Coemansia sp. RSA 988]